MGRADQSALATGLLALALHRVAHAGEPLPALVVTRSAGAEDCPDAKTLAREVARLNGRPALAVEAQSTTDTWLYVEISRRPEGYAAVIRAQGGRTGERQLSDTSPSCDNLADAVSLTLAMVLDNHAYRTSIAPAPPRRLVPQWAPPHDTVQWHVTSIEVDAAVGVHVGMLAHAGPLILAQGRLWIGRALALELGALYAFEQTIEHRGSAGRLDVELVSGMAGACAGLSATDSSVQLALCAEGQVGRLRGTGRGFTSDRPPQDHLWLGGGLGLDVAGKIAGPLMWDARVAALLVREQRFIVRVDETDETLFASSPAAVLGAVALRAHFE